MKKSRTLTFTIPTERKHHIKDGHIWIIDETKENTLKRHIENVNKLDELLSKICIFEHYEMKAWHFMDGSLERIGYDTTYFIYKKNKGITWNDIYKTVNSVKAVPYKFLKY